MIRIQNKDKAHRLTLEGARRPRNHLATVVWIALAFAGWLAFAASIVNQEAP